MSNELEKPPTPNKVEAEKPMVEDTGLVDKPVLEEAKQVKEQKPDSKEDDSRKKLLRKYTGGMFYPSSTLV